MKDGFGTYKKINGDVYEGQWKFNKEHGQGKLKTANGKITEGIWR